MVLYDCRGVPHLPSKRLAPDGYLLASVFAPLAPLLLLHAVAAAPKRQQYGQAAVIDAQVERGERCRPYREQCQ